MNIQSFKTLSETDQSLLSEASERISHALNKVSNPKTSVIVVTKNGRYYGNNIFLSNCSLMCAEAAALAASVAANDTEVEKLYFAVGRDDTTTPKLISPCGNCRQMLHDFAHLNGNVIQIFSTTNALEEVMITDSAELLPEGFRSASLGKMAGSNTK
jgi:cytidine deaminase